MNDGSLLADLTALVGEQYVVDHPTGYAIYGQSPLLTVAPGSLEELAQTVARLAAERVAIVPWGGGTQQMWGRPPARPFAVVITNRLSRILDYTPDDLTISVEAGMTLGALSTALAANGQMLPIDAPLPERATIGGLLATAMDGPRRLGYGSARDLLIGIRVVEATGRISKAGGMVVKNVSGFDMMKLYLGSFGTLAIIASANFKLIPQPRASASILCRATSPEPLWKVVNAIAASQLTPVAVEYLEGVELTGATFALAVRSEGLPAAVERHLRDVTSFATQAGVRAEVLRDEAHSSLWTAINDLPQTATVAADELVVRVTCLPATMPGVLATVRMAAQRLNVPLQGSVRALNGVAYLRVRGAVDQLREWHAAILQAAPQTTIMAAPAALVVEAPVFGAQLPNLDLMQRIKQEFDPEHLLNPGRFVV
ncbi:MAG TPA: FAD-binding oxidoreductase [Chloroflexus aurantiacus]|jgi:glycolate oxidase FAD binding subunit|uniref:FAD linked oxidase domain protein n=1 Tax=Chloroflexus aurantiacus (strain ATCC 29366 / DSM 635 / J-10-fl) TaxID=324602 RepID=A9WF30_CHLAA|nr:MULTISPECIES: FAD-binding oxidoreductase [Chloroflexus]ABY35345.1 FAD linked oxidase domain protein [Chloroflexus aurantiacus J-10-fl]RMG45970.1 MAG: FAD-binding oxidoreductase [Chloroflexota bacterium]GIV92238.1 MAG: FAD-linked oxidase [Chloroflexus sp.]HBW66521.1 FAD-binding oxidoreductase [Chloroflexus aurantiacus]